MSHTPEWLELYPSRRQVQQTAGTSFRSRCTSRTLSCRTTTNTSIYVYIHHLTNFNIYRLEIIRHPKKRNNRKEKEKGLDRSSGRYGLRRRSEASKCSHIFIQITLNTEMLADVFPSHLPGTQDHQHRLHLQKFLYHHTRHQAVELLLSLAVLVSGEGAGFRDYLDRLFVDVVIYLTAKHAVEVVIT